MKNGLGDPAAMITYTLEPYVGPLPLRFGMTPEEVEAIIGPADFSHPVLMEERRGPVTLSYGFDDRKLFAAKFSPGASVLLREHDLFSEPDLISFLRDHDPDCRWKSDSLLFPRLGLRVDGFGKPGEQGTIGLLEKEYMDVVGEDSLPYAFGHDDRMTFTIEPYVGPLPLRFGMSPEEVESVLGPPEERRNTPYGLSERRRKPSVNLGYELLSKELEGAVFAFTEKLLYQEHDLFAERDLISLLRQYDPNPFLLVGFVIFLKLGVRLAGFHNDDDERSIGVFSEGFFDQFREDLEPFDEANRQGSAE